MSDRPLTRPFRILGIQQIAVGGLDKDRLRTLWVDTLGLELDGNYRSEKENVDEDIAFLGQGAQRVEVDLMQPLDAEQRPRVDTPPLNHVGLWVDDLPDRCRMADANRACASPRAVFARARRVTISVSFTRKVTKNFRLAGKGF